MKNTRYLYFSFLQLLQPDVEPHHSLFASPSLIPVSKVNLHQTQAVNNIVNCLICFLLITVSVFPQYNPQFSDVIYNSVKTEKALSKTSATVFKPSLYRHMGYDQAIKVTLNYDESGNLIEQIIEELSLARGKDRFSYFYDKNEKLISKILESWGTDSWVNKMKWSFEYHSLDNKVVETYDVWKNDSWVTNEINTSTFDSHGNRTVFRMDVLSNGVKQPSYLINRTYNSNSKILSDESYYWSENTWKNENRTTYSYDSKNRLISQTYEKGSGSDWTNVSRQIHEYDETGNQELITGSKWDGSKWVNETKTERNFNSEGNVISEILSKWINNQFTPDKKTEFIYSSPLLLDTVKGYSMENQIWKEDRRVVYKFDEFGNTIAGDSYYLTTEGWRGILGSLEFWFNNHSESMKFVAASADMQYIQVNTTHNLPANPESFVLSQNYPNPFNPETVIKFALPEAGYVKGVVYDILGREVTTLLNGEMNPGNHEVKFDAVGLSSGVYLFRLESGKYSSAIKMVVGK